MKKILFILLLTLFFIPGVKAEELIFNYSNSYGQYYEDFDDLYSEHKSVIDNLYSDLMSFYNSNYKDDYPFYYLELVAISDYTNTSLDNVQRIFLGGQAFKEIPSISSCSSDSCFITSSLVKFYTYYDFSDSTTFGPIKNDYSYHTLFYENYFLPMRYYESNFDLINNSSYDIKVTNYQSNDIIYSPGDTIPSLKTIYNNKFKEVNLDNYEYVILSLKDYSQTEAFDVSLSVKGMIGITPVYEFGTVEKSEITDRCNISYSDYTDYRLYVLKSDLLNNAVYYVKECEEGSAFKFDTSVFDITYVTADNVDDVVITVGGVEYHTISFDNLSNSANKNEEENFIPGESGSSLTDIIDNISENLNSVWKSITSFMSLVTKVFNTLPEEIRAVCIVSFTVGVTLGIIKVLKS